MITGMGIPSSQSSSPRPIVRFLELFQQRSSGTTLARRSSTLEGLVTPPVHRYPTAPCDHQRDMRAIGSADASKCWEKKRRMGRNRSRLRTVSAIAYFARSIHGDSSVQGAKGND